MARKFRKVFTNPNYKATASQEELTIAVAGELTDFLMQFGDDPSVVMNVVSSVSLTFLNHFYQCDPEMVARFMEGVTQGAKNIRSN